MQHYLILVLIMYFFLEDDCSLFGSESDASSCSLFDSDSDDQLFSDAESEVDSAYESEKDEFLKKVYKRSKYTLADFLLDFIKLFKTFKISKNCGGAILKLISKYLPSRNIVPGSKKSFMNLIEKICPPIRQDVVYNCNNCFEIIRQPTKPLYKCPKCKLASLSVSLENNVEDILRYFFEKRNLSGKIDKELESRNKVENIITDIHDGANFKAVPLGTADYTLHFIHNVDGFPMGNSSIYQCWPNFLAIADINSSLRSSYLILSNIYCGPCKPDMNLYLKNWVESMETLGNEGFTWMHPELKTLQSTKASVVVSADDAQARAPLQALSYYNGAYGCSFCEIKSEPLKGIIEDENAINVFEKEASFSRTCYYPYRLGLNARLRTKKNMMEQAAIMVDPKKIGLRNKNEKTMFGVKGFSQMAFLPHFDIAKGFSPDMLHACLLGTVRRHLNILFDSKYKEKEFYLTQGYRNLISEKLLKIKPPSFITRLPRSLKFLKQWKGSEFMWWLILYSLPCLENVFKNKRHFEHQILLVRVVHSLLDENISFEEIDYCKILLKRFHSHYADLYDPQEETFNLHVMCTHFSDSVKLCGPLWASSTFLFESANNFLKRSIHGNNNVAKEISNTSKIYSAFDVLKIMCNNHKTVTDKSVVFGSKKTWSSLSTELYDFLNQIDGLSDVVNVSVFERAKFNGFTFTTESYKKAFKTCSYYALVKDLTWNGKEVNYVKLVCFVESTDKNLFIAKIVKGFGSAYKSVEFDVEVKHIKISVDTNVLVWGTVDKIVKPIMKIGDKICIPPKIWNKNL